MVGLGEVEVVCKESDLTDRKRDLFYAGESICAALYFIYSWDPLDSIQSNQILPTQMIVYIVGIELLKIFLALVIYPASPMSFYHQISKDMYYFGDQDSLKYKLPVIVAKKTSWAEERFVQRVGGAGRKDITVKVFETLKAIAGFMFSVGLCHVLVVLFGAPFVQDWVLTFQFSIVLASWLFLPFVTSIPPASVLFQIFYMSSWENVNESILRQKWRFIFTIFGAWVGAVVIPLDWDVPWQKWPIPCLYSVTWAHVLINTFYFLYLTFYFSTLEMREHVLRQKSKTKPY